MALINALYVFSYCRPCCAFTHSSTPCFLAKVSSPKPQLAVLRPQCLELPQMSIDDRANARAGPSSFYQQQPGQSQIIRPPIGFARSDPSAFGSSAPTPQYAPPSQAAFDAPPDESGKKKRHKDRGKEKDKDKSKSRDKSKSKHRSHKEPQPPSSTVHVGHASYGSPPAPSPSFRVSGYSNEPSPAGSVYMPLHGHYPANYSMNSQPTTGNYELVLHHCSISYEA